MGPIRIIIRFLQNLFYNLSNSNFIPTTKQTLEFKRVSNRLIRVVYQVAIGMVLLRNITMAVVKTVPKISINHTVELTV